MTVIWSFVNPAASSREMTSFVSSTVEKIPARIGRCCFSMTVGVDIVGLPVSLLSSKESAEKALCGLDFASIKSTRFSTRENIMPAVAHLSYWHETAGRVVSHFPPLETNIDVDVAILGGGITGLTAAIHLQQAGYHVAVLEAGQIGCGTTGFTSGHLDATTDLALSRMIFE